MTDIVDDLMSYVHSVAKGSAAELRTAIEQALLQAHKEGFDAALLPGSVPDAQPVAAFDQWWDSDKPELADNPYRHADTAAYWAWAAWQAATLAEREHAAKVCEGMVRMDRHGYPDYPSSYAEQCAAAIRGTK